jgi:Sec-independent protein translocase protein TatA
MDFLGVGPLELFFIIIIALIVLGPKDMVKTGRTLGLWMRKLVTSPFWRQMRETSSTMRNMSSKLMREAGLEDLPKQLSTELTDLNHADKPLGDWLKQDIDHLESGVDLTSWTTPPARILPPELADQVNQEPLPADQAEKPQDTQTDE